MDRVSSHKFCKPEGQPKLVPQDTKARKTEPPTTGGPRYPLLDLVRVAAMLDVVSIHVAGRTFFWGAGVPAFIVMSVALAVRKPEPPALTVLAPRRAGRVLLPWLVWSLVFGLSGLAGSMSDPARSVGDQFHGWMLPVGTRIHLWFLPFIFLAELAAVSAVRPLRRLPPAAVVAGAMATGVAMLSATGWVHDRYAPIYEGMTMGSPNPDERAHFFGWMARRCWLYGTVSVCLGVALGRALSASCPDHRRLLRALWGGSVAMLIVAVVMNAAAPESRVVGGISESTAAQWLAQGVGFAAVTAAFQLAGNGPAALERVGALTIGVYLLHMWVDLRIADAMQILRVEDWATEVPWLVDGPGRIVMACIATAVLVAALRCWKPMRRVL